jgi:hypothetical protein
MKPRDKSENVIGHYSAQEFVARAFSGVVALWPAGSREWALAMQAEIPEIQSSRESLQWLAGGIMSLIKAWWNRAIYGWKDGETEPSAIRTPGPAACALAVIALVAFFALPSVREGFKAVSDSWPPYNNSHLADYQRMAREAEADHDAKTLAFLSSRMNSLDENARLANEAVTMDPSLTWIYMRGANLWFSYRQVAEKQGWMQKLVASDPDNAAPYLAEAVVRDSELWMQNNYTTPRQKSESDPAWRAAMEKAFAAPRYDYYYDRAIDLQVSELRAHNLLQPQDVASHMREYYALGMFDAQKYSNFLLDQAREAQKKGDTATALHLAWSIMQFAERARANLHNEYSRGTVDAMTLSAAEFLQPIEAAAGHTEVAKLLAIDKETIQRKMATKAPAPMENWFRPLDATGIALHFAGIGVILFGSAAIFSVLLLLAGRFSPALRTSWLYRWACNCGRFAPAGLATAVVLMAATFAPYLEAVRDYFAGMKDTATLNALTGMEDSLYRWPNRIMNPMTRPLFDSYLWMGLLAVVIIAGALFLSRNAFRPREPRVRAA